ncbi:hypothetical protein BU15DRAFT_66995 [Melanogaster broomeanus]|nr:hypothetical protein BU15DRAFT_66995 [Melanogaster broomeanus]
MAHPKARTRGRGAHGIQKFRSVPKKASDPNVGSGKCPHVNVSPSRDGAQMEHVLSIARYLYRTATVLDQPCAIVRRSHHGGGAPVANHTNSCSWTREICGHLDLLVLPGLILTYLPAALVLIGEAATIPFPLVHNPYTADHQRTGQLLSPSNLSNNFAKARVPHSPTTPGHLGKPPQPPKVFRRPGGCPLRNLQCNSFCMCTACMLMEVEEEQGQGKEGGKGSNRTVEEGRGDRDALLLFSPYYLVILSMPLDHTHSVPDGIMLVTYLIET